MPNPDLGEQQDKLRHPLFVRVTHWLTFVCCCALLLSGVEILLSHPRFYWGETGHSGTRALFTIPVPSSRDTVPTGYKYVLPDQNGWSRALHFEAAWLLVMVGAVYVGAGLWSGHFRRNLLPAEAERNVRSYWQVLQGYLRREPASDSGGSTYNVAQRTAYLGVVFLLVPGLIWTGLAMSPAFAGVAPYAVSALGGRQSARTLHFLLTGGLVLFVIGHVALVVHAGFRSRMRAMITGRGDAPVASGTAASVEHV